MADLLPNANRTRGNPVDYLLDRTLRRPRDAIAFANECLEVGAGKARLTWDDIHTAEGAYSAKRLLALRDEWKISYPGIDRVFEVFRRAPARLTKREFQTRLDDAFVLLWDHHFSGTVWMIEFSQSLWSATDDTSWFRDVSTSNAISITLGFIGCCLGARDAPVYYMDNPLLLDNESTFERIAAFFVHPTYHAALDVSGRAASF